MFEMCDGRASHLNNIIKAGYPYLESMLYAKCKNAPWDREEQNSKPCWLNKRAMPSQPASPNSMPSSRIHHRLRPMSSKPRRPRRLRCRPILRLGMQSSPSVSTLRSTSTAQVDPRGSASHGGRRVVAGPASLLLLSKHPLLSVRARMMSRVLGRETRRQCTRQFFL